MSHTPHPLRIRLSRKAGSRKPPGAVVVARPSKWGNPFHVGAPGHYWGNLTRRNASGVFDVPGAAVGLFRWWLQFSDDGRELLAQIEELRGKQLACWCALDKPCHADVLAELANA